MSRQYPASHQASSQVQVGRVRYRGGQLQPQSWSLLLPARPVPSLLCAQEHSLISVFMCKIIGYQCPGWCTSLGMIILLRECLWKNLQYITRVFLYFSTFYYFFHKITTLNRNYNKIVFCKKVFSKNLSLQEVQIYIIFNTTCQKKMLSSTLRVMASQQRMK